MKGYPYRFKVVFAIAKVASYVSRKCTNVLRKSFTEEEWRAAEEWFNNKEDKS